MNVTTKYDHDLVRVIVVVEGTNDIEFLRRISRILSAYQLGLPCVADMETRGELVFVPFGGGHVRAWTDRLAPLARPEFHLYDHELPPETDCRIEAAEAVNHRHRCRAVLTRKRSLENYLHPAAIASAGDIDVTFDDFDPVAALVAKQLYRQRPGEKVWELHTSRARSRMAHRAKHWLNTVAVNEMTMELLLQRDPDGEVISWLSTINQLARER